MESNRVYIDMTCDWCGEQHPSAGCRLNPLYLSTGQLPDVPDSQDTIDLLTDSQYQEFDGERGKSGPQKTAHGVVLASMSELFGMPFSCRRVQKRIQGELGVVKVLKQWTALESHWRRLGKTVEDIDVEELKKPQCQSDRTAQRKLFVRVFDHSRLAAQTFVDLGYIANASILHLERKRKVLLSKGEPKSYEKQQEERKESLRLKRITKNVVKLGEGDLAVGEVVKLMTRMSREQMETVIAKAQEIHAALVKHPEEPNMEALCKKAREFKAEAKESTTD